MHSIKQADLIPYMYGEVSIEQSNAISVALETDWELRNHYEELIAAQKNLEPISLSPRTKAVDFVMNYANKSVNECSTG